jgi:hypothetical protein
VEEARIGKMAKGREEVMSGREGNRERGTGGKRGMGVKRM